MPKTPKKPDQKSGGSGGAATGRLQTKKGTRLSVPPGPDAPKPSAGASVGAQGKGGTTGETYWGRPGLNNAKYAPRSGVGNGAKRGRPPGVKNGQGRGKR